MTRDNMKYYDYKFFVQNYEQIYRQYGHSYIVIKNKTVLGSYPSIIEALLETNKSEESGSYIIQECYPIPEELL